MSTRNLGLLGEQIASKFLENLGYKILEKNFHSKFGEIDIVALDKDILVFVEVKTRWSENFGLPEESITPWKIRKIIKTADYYKLLHPQLPESLRIDALAIDIGINEEIKDIRHFKNISQ
jgi:putative endonuclease